MSGTNSDLIPVRMLTQFAYCSRLAYMEWVQGEFEYNASVVEGKYQHRNVDTSSGNKKIESRKEDEIIHARSVTISDNKLGMIAKTDLLEIQGKSVTPIEYKHGNVPDTPEKTYKDHRVQLCAQALLLRANGYLCTQGIVYYISSKQRIKIEFDDRLVAETLQMIYDMKKMALESKIPPPLVDSPKCPGCSLVGICLPDETNVLTDVIQIKNDNIRRMYPIRNDSWPVHVQEQGAYVSLLGDSINIKSRNSESVKVRLLDVSELSVYGNVQISTQAIRKMCERDIPISYHTYGGWFVGMISGAVHKNIELRINQHKKHVKKTASLAIARQFVHGKIKNSITMLRRNHTNPDEVIINLEQLAEQTKTVKKYDVLLGIEGLAARHYFSEFNGMIKENRETFHFTDRNRRPPKDPINAMLSFLYAMLVRQAVVTVSQVGFDPYLGFLHMPKYGKPSLALDIIEEFRPVVADSVCITLINNGMITPKDMIQTEFGVNLTSDGRRKVIKSYEHRMDSTIKHAILGYTVSYRRVMETQARLLARHISDEIPIYPIFRTR